MATEMEAKLELQPDVYFELLAHGVIKREIEQLNVYYDLEWILAGKGATFRIRFANGSQPVCTFKVPVSTESSGLRIAQELEAPLKAAMMPRRSSAAPSEILAMRHLASEYRDALRTMNVERLVRVGWVRNRRTVVEINGLGEIEVDLLRLPNGSTVFEAEIEHSDRSVIQALSEFLVRRWPSCRPSTVGKFERFRRAAVEARMKPLGAHSPSPQVASALALS